MLHMKGLNMAEFNLGLAQCRASERAEGACNEYIQYFKKNNINELEEPENPLVKNSQELWDMDCVIDKCQNEEDIQKVLDRIKYLRELIK